MNNKVVIADDEDLARLRIRRMLTEYFPEMEITGEAANGIEAKTMIDALKPDLVFLDIEMPGATGIDVAKSTRHTPFIVFITAYSGYALEAFKTMALDYILKPVTKEQLEIAIKKYTQLAAPRDIKQLLSKLTEKMNETGIGRFRVTKGDSVKFLPHDQIICFEADQKYTTVFTEDTQYITNKTLQELESQLPKDTFIRIHRKHIVNINYILEVKRWIDRKMKVILNVPFDRDLIVSRSYTEVIDKL